MAFDNHLFISYARVDDVHVDEDPKGWIAHFHTTLASFLKSALAEPPVIWRDEENLAGNADIPAEIKDRIGKTAVMVSVVSEGYMKSWWCQKEITEFVAAADATGGLSVQNKLRVLQVNLRRLDPESEQKWPDRLKRPKAYDFFKAGENGATMLIHPRFGAEYSQIFNSKVWVLASEMAETIKAVIHGEPPTPPGPAKPTVYLAETSWDRADDREALRQELRATGYPVIPEEGARLPDREQEYIAEVNRLLTLATLSVHMIGASAAKVPDGPGRKDVVQLQNELAAAQSEQRRLPRVLWLPTAVSTQPDHQTFIDALRTRAELQRGGDLIEDNLQGFKSATAAALKKLETPALASPPPDEPAAAPLIYVIALEADRAATRSLRKFLFDAGFEVQLPVFQGDAATMRQASEDALIRCVAAIVFYGAGDEGWKRTIDADLQKCKSGRGGRPLVRCTYLSQPITDDKTDCLVMKSEPNLMNALESLPESELQALVAAWKGAR